MGERPHRPSDACSFLCRYCRGGYQPGAVSKVDGSHETPGSGFSWLPFATVRRVAGTEWKLPLRERACPGLSRESLHGIIQAQGLAADGVNRLMRIPRHYAAAATNPSRSDA